MTQSPETSHGMSQCGELAIKFDFQCNAYYVYVKATKLNKLSVLWENELVKQLFGWILISSFIATGSLAPTQTTAAVPSPQSETPAKTEMPAGLWQAFNKARHQIESDDVGYQASNHGNNQHYRFTADGLTVYSTQQHNNDWQFDLRLTGIGSPENIQDVEPAIISIDGQRIEYQRGNITEWYENKSIGLEQGFTIAKPLNPINVTLVVQLAIEGDLQAEWQQAGQSLTFHQPDGSYALTYNKLLVEDANNNQLPAHLTLNEGNLQIHVALAGATFPIIIDPLIVNEQKVTARVSDSQAGDWFGASVAIDGDTALVGSRHDQCGFLDCGSGYIFTRANTAWTLVAKLTASDPSNGRVELGFPVVLVGDTAVMGRRFDGAGTAMGAVYVFVKPVAGWSDMTETAKLTASDRESGDQLGRSVALSGDTLLAGAPFDDCIAGSGCGTVYVFEKPGGGWATTSAFDAKLTASDADAADHFGVALSFSGDTAAVGQFKINTSDASVYIFEKPAGGWIAPTTEDAKLTASDAALNDRFGTSISISADTLLVGSNADDPLGSDSGSAYIFEKPVGGWSGSLTEDAKLTASDGTNGQRFGQSVGLMGSTAVIGADRVQCLGVGAECGAVYVFDEPLTGWSNMTETVKLTASDQSQSDRFGFWVAISGESVLVGAIFDNNPGFESGSAYVFKRNLSGEWGQQTKLSPTKNDAAATEAFGFSVALSGDTALVGASLADHCDPGPDCGAAYVFTRSGSTWAAVAKLTASDAAGGDDFGHSVALSDDTALVGARWDDCDDIQNCGSAYIFEKPANGWRTTDIFTAKLTASDGGDGDEFGFAVALSGDTAMVGAPENNGASIEQGAAYVFVKPGDGWANATENAKLTSSEGGISHFLGISVAISGDTALVGAQGFERAYIFEKPDTGWTTTNVFDARLTASDAAAGDWFGTSAALWGETALLGAPKDDCDAGSECGAAYLFEKPGGGWADMNQTAKLISSNLSNQFLGTSVALWGDTALLGASGDDCGAGLDCGAAYVFTKPGTGWTNMTQTAKLTSSTADDSDEFGISVAVSDFTALVGAHLDDDDGSASGSAFFFTFPCGFAGDLPLEEQRPGCRTQVIFSDSFED